MLVPAVRKQFDRRLLALNEDILELGRWVHLAVSHAIDVYRARDPEGAREIIRADNVVNDRRYQIERECYALLATEQPVARDMRTIASALIVVSDLERIGDHGKRIARITLRLIENPVPFPFDEIPHLAELALAMLDRALRAYGAKDVEEANAVCQADDEVDALYRQTFNIILSHMLENMRLIGPGTQLLQIAHELERVADRATNIGERVIFSVTGELKDLNV